MTKKTVAFWLANRLDVLLAIALHQYRLRPKRRSSGEERSQRLVGGSECSRVRIQCIQSSVTLQEDRSLFPSAKLGSSHRAKIQPEEASAPKERAKVHLTKSMLKRLIKRHHRLRVERETGAQAIDLLNPKSICQFLSVSLKNDLRNHPGSVSVWRFAC